MLFAIGFGSGVAVYGFLMCWVVGGMNKRNTSKAEDYNKTTVRLLGERNVIDEDIAHSLRLLSGRGEPGLDECFREMERIRLGYSSAAGLASPSPEAGQSVSVPKPKPAPGDATLT